MDRMDKSKISHPYPPSYRVEASPEPPRGYNNQDPYQSPPQHTNTDLHLTRSRSTSDPTAPLTPHVLKKSRNKPETNTKPKHKHKSTTHHGIVRVGMVAGLVSDGARKDENGLDIPPGWDEKDEESEREFMKKGMFDWKALMGWRYWIRKEWWGGSCPDRDRYYC